MELEKEKTVKVYTISCQTGCTCCSNENHSLGFYESKEAAERRIARFLDPNLKENPVASQYARKGRYSVESYDAEKISRNRIIISDHVYEFHGFTKVNEDGTAENETRIDDYL